MKLDNIIFYDNLPTLDLHGYDRKTAIVAIYDFINDNIQELALESNPLEGEDNKLKLCVVSRLSNGKGFDRLLKLVESLEKNNISYILNIIGKGRTMEDEIKEWFSPYTNVHFIGYRDNPYNYVKNSDYLIL
mgnify:CR=1 FL=1